nr:MAG TPA: hypothetical protein [Caudoviricetes sp.]
MSLYKTRSTCLRIPKYLHIIYKGKQGNPTGIWTKYYEGKYILSGSYQQLPS